MPRKAPKEVIEHRVTLGNFERDLLVKEMADSKENNLYVAGINQAGQIVGSGVLLWAAAAYFGINLVTDVKDKIDDFIDYSSTGISNAWMQVFGGFTPTEAAFITKLNDELNARIKEINRLELFDDVAIQGIMAQLKAGDIEYSTAQAMLAVVGETKEGYKAEREQIVEARTKLANFKAQKGQGALEIIMENWNEPGLEVLAEIILSW